MKSKIYGRKQGSIDEYSLLVESDGVDNRGVTPSAEFLQKQHEFEMTNLCRNVNLFREKNVEGYVILDNDPTQYQFSPNEEFTITGRILH